MLGVDFQLAFPSTITKSRFNWEGFRDIVIIFFYEHLKNCPQLKHIFYCAKRVDFHLAKSLSSQERGSDFQHCQSQCSFACKLEREGIAQI